VITLAIVNAADLDLVRFVLFSADALGMFERELA